MLNFKLGAIKVEYGSTFYIYASCSYIVSYFFTRIERT